jgi:hypothetical protein
MRRIGWAARFLAVANLVFTPLVARAAGDVDQVLVEWQKRMAKVTTIDVRFRSTRVSRPWDDEKYEGRLVLASSNLALFEKTSLDKAGKPKEDREKSVWTGSDFLLFQFEEQKVLRFHEKSVPNDPPIPLCIPFLFQMSVDRAKELYEWSFVKEDADQVLIAAVNRKKVDNPGWPNKYFISLDKRTYLPLKVFVDDKSDRETYDLSSILVNSPIDLSELKEPCLDAWEIAESGGWFPRWFLR